MSYSLESPSIDPAGKFADPFILAGRSSAPLELRTALDYCRFLYHQVAPMYRAASKRVVGHFTTRLAYRGKIGSPDERKEFEQFFREELGGFDALRLAGEEFMCYGNAFVRVHKPFVRILLDRRDGDFKQYSLNQFHPDSVKFDLKTMAYLVPDPKAIARAAPGASEKRISLTFWDRPTKNFSDIRIRVLDPRYCLLLYSESTGDTQVQYRFTPTFRSRIRRGELFEVNQTPADILKTIRDEKDYLFDRKAVRHLRNPTISGVSNEGWGLPEILSHLPNIHRIAVYDKIDESIGLDYMAPFRIMAPNLSGLGNDGASAMMLGRDWVPSVKKMLAEQRMDRTAVHGFPFPFMIQEMGGNGRQLSPKDLKEFEVKNLLNCASIPVEFFNMSLTSQQWAPSLRLFESSHSPLAGGLAGLARFLVSDITSYMFGEAFDATLASPQDVDNIERRNLLMSMYSAGEIPKRLVLDGITEEEGQALKLERARDDYRVQQELAVLEAEEKRKAQLGSIDAVLEGAQGGGGEGSQAAMTPTDLRAKAEQLAQQWLAIPSDGQRAQAMQQVKSVDRDLYAVAYDVMEQIRSQGASQGRQQVNQQYQQQGVGQQ